MYMNAEDYLKQIELLDIQIQQDIERLDELKNSANGVSAIRYDKDRVQTSASGDRLCTDVCAIVGMEQKINDEIDRLYDTKERIIAEIRELGVADYVQILYKRYVQFKTLKQVAAEMGRGYTTILQKHQDALVLFASKM